MSDVETQGDEYNPTTILLPEVISQNGRITKLEGGLEGKMISQPPENPADCVSQTAKAKCLRKCKECIYLADCSNPSHFVHVTLDDHTTCGDVLALHSLQC